MTLSVRPDLAKLRKKRLYIATPCYGGLITAPCAVAQMQTSIALHELGVTIRMDVHPGDSLIPRARNQIAHKFMHSDFTHLLFWDADLKLVPDDIITLLSYDYGVVGGFYVKKGISWHGVAEAAKRGVTDPTLLEYAGMDLVVNFKVSEFRPDCPVEVRHLGTGFMMIEKSVFTRMAAAMPELRYRPYDDEHGHMAKGADCFHNFFGCEIDRPTEGIFTPGDVGGTNTLLSEDWFFSRNCQRLEIPIMACPWFRSSHFGTYEYKMDFQKIAEASGQSGTFQMKEISEQPVNGDGMLLAKKEVLA